MQKLEYKQIAVAALFAVAMAFLESAVVIYLRLLYCPDGHLFPMTNLMESRVVIIEASRELATLVMLAGVSYLAASRFKDRFAYFLLTFAVWDIFYYVWLKAAIGWPESSQTFDVLFLIPWPWVSPVLAPVLASLTMIALALCLLTFPKDLNKTEWALLSLGSLIMLCTYLSDYGGLIVRGNYFKDFLNLGSNPEFQKALAEHIPGGYNWVLFGIAEAFLIVAIILYQRRMRKD